MGSRESTAGSWFRPILEKNLDFLKTDRGHVVKWLEYAILVATRFESLVIEVGNCDCFP